MAHRDRLRTFLGAERAGRALVGDRGVEITVDQDDGAALEGGPHAGGDVVGAVGGIQEDFLIYPRFRNRLKRLRSIMQ